jgi:hypothetical protein
MRLMEMRCAEPDLCAETVARDAAISLRAPHQLFEPSGTTFHEQLTQQRLARAEACCAIRRGGG